MAFGTFMVLAASYVVYRRQVAPSSARCTCREEGFAGLWRGVTPNIGRNAIINAAELASYDSVSPGQACYQGFQPRRVLPCGDQGSFASMTMA